MRRRLFGIVGLCALALSVGCRAKTRCEDLSPQAIAGKYRGGGSLGDDRMFDVSVEATDKQVTLTYTGKDGSRIRAFYRVAKKSTKP